MQKILIIVGPTAIGKSDLAITLAQEFNGEIISGDSMQVYQEVAIGTARPTAQQLAAVPHHLVAERSIYTEFGVKEFVTATKQLITEITARGKLPIIAGGTGFYLSALLYDLQLGEQGDYQNPVEPQFVEYLAQEGPQKLWELLQQQDSAAAALIPYQNSRRVLRALSVIYRTGKLFSAQQPELHAQYDAKIIGLNTDRELVYQRINQRVEQMLKQGLLDEAQFVYQNQKKMKQAIQAIGYKEFFPYFAGEQDLAMATAKLQQASRKYAKRQLTYFRNKLPTVWFDPIKDEDYYRKIVAEIKKWR